MALSRNIYCWANVTADDTTVAKRVTTSWLHAVVAFLMQLKSGTTGTNGTPPAAAAWSMYYSCNGTTAGTAGDGVNRIMTANAYDQSLWTRAAAGVAHSWFVLRSPTNICAALPGVPFYLIGDYGTAADTTFNLYLSKAAPTGGTTTARPTAVDEVGFTNAVMSDVTLSTHRLFFVTDAVGNFALTYARSSAGLVHTLFSVQQLTAPGLQAGELFPMVIVYDSVSSGRGAGGSAQLISASGFNGTGGMVSRSPLNNVAPTSGTGNGMLVPLASNWVVNAFTNQATGRQDVLPVQYLFVSSSAIGIKGTVPDWFVGNSTHPPGNCDPSTGALEHMFIGNVWMPCGGLAPTL